MYRDWKVIYKPAWFHWYWRCNGCARGEHDEPQSLKCPDCSGWCIKHEWFYPSYDYLARSWEMADG